MAKESKKRKSPLSESVKLESKKKSTDKKISLNKESIDTELDNLFKSTKVSTPSSEANH